jgi:hypothetical protein
MRNFIPEVQFELCKHFRVKFVQPQRDAPPESCGEGKAKMKRIKIILPRCQTIEK